MAGALLLGLSGPTGGCAGPDAGPAAASPAAPATPTGPAGLEQLLLPDVPSGLPRVPDDELDPPAGEKSLEDVAGYGGDADREREVLDDYGYRWGWERFWRSGDTQTSVFVDQFDDPAGALAYAADLRVNDGDYYGGRAAEPTAEPTDGTSAGTTAGTGALPSDCAVMTVEQPAPETRLTGPAAFAWCTEGVFTVSVTAVAADPETARAELGAVVTAQLERLSG